MSQKKSEPTVPSGHQSKGKPQQGELQPFKGLDFPVVGIGASAGGLEAVSGLLEEIPADIGMAFVLVQHLSADHESMMTELLSRVTKLKVVEITDGLAIEPNTVYVIPPNFDIGILNSVLHLFPRTTKQHLPIDYFFTSLAKDQGSNAIGIIMSGSASDGSQGLLAIKAEQGITMAQSPKTARYDSMPSSAIDTDCVDFILSPADIAKELIKLARVSNRVIAEVISTQQVGKNTANELGKIFILLRQHTGNDFSQYKQSTILRRVGRQMMINKIGKLEDYVRYLNENPQEINRLLQDILINVTAFFRDPKSFEALQKKVFPKMIQDLSDERPLRIWVTGCSTGEEVYSIVISLLECLGDKLSRTKIQVFASDIDEQAIEKARAGIYPEVISKVVSQGRLQRFFSKVTSGYQINKWVRDLIVFANQNITNDPPFSHMDLVVCRNLLIYMNNTLQRRVLHTLHYALNHGGVLFLGSSETVGVSADIFSTLDSEHKLYTKKDISKNIRYRGVASLADTLEPQNSIEKSAVARAKPVDLQQFAESIVLSRYSPPGVVVNKQLEIIQFIGNTGPFMEPSPGGASLNLVKLVHPDLTAELRIALHNAARDNTLTRASNIHLHRGDIIEDITIDVLPLKIQVDSDAYLLVIFKKNSEYDTRAAVEEASTPEGKAGGPEESEHIQKLKREQEISKAYLQAIIEDHEVSNEELQAANEEIQSTNEELQSTNEELETAKEELQSTNEELITVNEELANRNKELHTSNDDLKNIISSTNLAVVMLNEDHRIRFFSPQAHKWLNLIEADIGRSIGDIRPNLNTGDISQLADQVIESLQPVTAELNDGGSNWYTMTIRPYRTEANKISGTVIVISDITESKLLQRASRLATVVEDSNDAVMVLNFNGDILEWNPKSVEFYGYSEHEAINNNIEMVVPPNRKAELKNIFKDLKQGKTVSPFESQRVSKDGKLQAVLVTVSALNNDQGEPVAVASTERLLN